MIHVPETEFNIIMKYLLLLLSIIVLFAGQVKAQNFDDALQLYEDQAFAEAAEIFSSLDDDRSQLFAGKSYFGLQDYLIANQYLRRVAENTTQDSYRQEALYTIALSHFRMKNFALSLDQLHELTISGERGRIRVDAQRIYRQIMRYMSPEQRIQVLRQTRFQEVAKNVVEHSYNFADRDQYDTILNGFLRTVTDLDQRRQLRDELPRADQVESIQRRYPAPPEGMVYNIGVILPADEENASNRIVPRNLYYGITLAAEEFNSQNPDKKVFLKYQNSYSNPDSTGRAFHDLVYNGFVDAVIGPLFSEPAKRMAKLSEEYRIPMFAPLANSDEINLDHNYTYQMNPTFEVHGKIMARHAVQTLRLDTLAVISQSNHPGTASARSFRREAERLGAFISYYIEEDFSSLGYDITQFTEVFTLDEEEIEEHNYIPTKGIYAPFSGQAANTLINLLLTDLEVMRSEMVILGSEEWENASLSNWQNRNFEIYYSKAFGERADSSTVEFVTQDFETRFGIETDRFAKIGFDVGTYIFQSLSQAGNPHYLGEVIRNKDPYDGLELSIHMDQKRINQSMFIQPLSNPAKERASR